MKRQGYGTFFNLIAAALVFAVGLEVIFDFGRAIAARKVFIQYGLMLCGIACIVSFIQNRRGYFRPGWILALGFVQFFIGLYILFLNSTQFTLENFTLLVGFWALVTAAIQMAGGIQLKALEVKRWWFLTAEGIINIIFAFILLIFPISGDPIMWRLTGGFLILLSIEIALESLVRKS